MATDDEAASVARPGLERTAAQRHALAHAGQAVPGAVRRCVAVPVVCDLELQLVVAPSQRHPRTGGAGVLEGVGEGLLHEAIGGEVDARWELALLALDLQVYLEPRLAHRPDQDVERAQRRLRGELRHRALLAEEADEPAHLGQRLAAR